MRLDHISYAAGAEGIASCVQRIGGQLGAGFADGGLHPRFGTRNFILPLTGGVYLEIVEALDHPAVERAAFGRAVRARTLAGGGWLSWVVGVSDLEPIEQRLGRKAVPGHRVRPDGFDLRWRQIGINDAAADPQLPWFTQWQSEPDHHPAAGGGTVSIEQLQIAGDRTAVVEFLGAEAAIALDELQVRWESPVDGDTGIIAVVFATARGPVAIT